MAQGSKAAGAIVGLTFAILLIEPIADSVSALSLSGSTETVVGLVPLFVGVLILGGLGLIIKEML